MQMYVCVCNAVTQAEVSEVIENGCHSRDAVTKACSAGGDCGSCHGMIDMMIEEHLDTAAHSGPQLVSAESLVRPTRAA